MLCFFVARRENVARREKKAHSPTSEEFFSLPEEKTSPEEKRKHTHQLQRMFGLTQVNRGTEPEAIDFDETYHHHLPNGR